MKLLISLVTKLPKDAHRHYLPDQIRRRYPDQGPIYYLDAWPLAQPFLVVTLPSTVSLFSHAENFLSKHPGKREFKHTTASSFFIVPSRPNASGSIFGVLFHLLNGVLLFRLPRKVSSLQNPASGIWGVVGSESRAESCLTQSSALSGRPTGRPGLKY